jgi:hypothetical protein
VVATILFIAHQVPKGLQIDELIAVSTDRAATIRVVGEGVADN